MASALAEEDRRGNREGLGGSPRPTKAHCNGEGTSFPIWAPDQRSPAPLRDSKYPLRPGG